MATFSGSAGVVKAGGNAIGEIRSFTVDQTGDTVEDTAMGDTTRSYKATLNTFTASIDALFDDTDTAQTAMTIGSSLAFLFQPEGSGSGAFQLSGSGIVTGISQTQSFDGLVERSFTVQGTGALTIGTV
jgi:hypothetical protein|tara:strand:+ start:345 stop:731 length:387 start_codon:yes stop_codon:yes gene_type:complete